LRKGSSAESTPRLLAPLGNDRSAPFRGYSLCYSRLEFMLDLPLLLFLSPAIEFPAWARLFRELIP
jgi:hypothetical protein